MKQSKPISSSWFTKKESTEPAIVITRDESVEDKSDSETQYKHTMAAIAAITEEDLEFFTPPEPAEEDLGDDAEEPPIFIEARPVIGARPTARPSITANDVLLKTLGVSGARRGSYQITSRRSSLHPKLVRSSTLANFQLMQHGGVFGSNKENVERILKRMADAIQMDLGRQ